MPQQHQDNVARTVYVTDDAILGKPREVTPEEINEVSAKRRAMSEEEKRECSRQAWKSMLNGDIKIKGVATVVNRND